LKTTGAYTCYISLHANQLLFPSDSLLRLQSLQIRNLSDPLIAEIVCRVHCLLSGGTSVVLCGFLNRVGLAGNSATAIAARAYQHTVSNLTVPRSHYNSLTGLRTQPRTGTETWQLHWNSGTENSLHSPRVNVINLFRLSSRDEIIIHRLRSGHTYLTHGQLDTDYEGRLPLGAWLFKSS